MLAAVVLVAGLFGSPRPVHSASAATCPAAPVASFTTAARVCPALEISGRAEMANASLDPAFDVTASPASLARVVDSRVFITGYAADGRKTFSLPLATAGAFHVYVPLAEAAQNAMARITLSIDGVTVAERTGAGAPEQAAELISLDESRVIVAWNAHAFPAIRISESLDRPPIASGNGTTTYEQLSVDTRARRLYVEFSDGVRSVTRPFVIFGR